MLKVENLTKSFGADVILEDVGFVVNPGERVGLVGRNGSGKSTLMRILAGTESPDSGAVTTPRRYRTAYLSQHLSFSGASALAEACAAIPAADDGRDQTYKAEAVLGGLGFGADEMHAPPSRLSGGFQVRLNLAKSLLEEPDLLLLDEPTNYLDIISLRWLRRFLNSWRGELVLITHDREFMDSVTTHTMGIHRRGLLKTQGPTWKLYGLIAEAEEIHEKTRANQEKKRREAEKFIDRFRAKASKASAVQSRIKALEKAERLEVLEGVKTLDFEFNYERYNPKNVLEAEGLSFAYPGAENLFEGVDLTLGRHDRVAVIGKNGKGKTTLLRLLAGELSPAGGSVKAGERVRVGYFGQTNVERLDPARTIEEELMAAHPDHNRRKARTVAGTMLFEGDAALKKVGVLSGGEKSRVLLGKILLSPVNLLLLDEPTNHLDMDSVDALTDALEAYGGAVVIVTHSEMILDRVADRLLVFDGGRVETFDGTYREFLEKVGWSDEAEGGGGTGDRAGAEGGTGGRSGGYGPGKGGVKARDGNVLSKKDIRKARAAIISERTRALGPLRTRMAEVEDRITGLEEELERLNAALVAAYDRDDAEEITRLSQAHHEATIGIDALFEELEGLSAEHDGINGGFEERLAELD